MLNFPLNLSKLSRGKGERKGSYIQVIYDDRDLNERNYGEFVRNHISDDRHNTQLETINENRKLNLPKTFTTRRGPLLLFSEDSRVQSDFYSDHANANAKQNAENNELKSFKTIRNLRRSILEFGNPKDFIYNRATTKNGSFLMDRENTLETFSLFKDTIPLDDPQFDKIRPGFSAKRYLSNWTRHWRPELFDNLHKEGRIKEESLFEQTDAMPNTRQRIDDDISRVPPVYRINRKWLTMTVAPLKGYRFYRVKTDLMGLYDETTEASVGPAPHIVPTDNIQVLDKDGKSIDYFNLSKSDKEIVLTELLLQTALQSIAEKRIESIEETFKQKLFSDNSNFESSSFLTHSDPNFLNGKVTIKDFNPIDLISSSTYVDKTMSSSLSASHYLFPRLHGNKLSPLKPSNPKSEPQPAMEPLRHRRRSVSQATPRIEHENIIDDSQFISNSLQNFQLTTTILEEKEEDIKKIELVVQIAEQIAEQITAQENIEAIEQSDTVNILDELPKTNPTHHISLILPEVRLTDSAYIESKRNKISVETTQIEIDPKILEEEKREEELLKKELETEALTAAAAANKLKSDTTVAINEMLSKKHYQSIVSMSNISIGDDFDPNLEQKTRKKNERFILNRHNYHHPRKPKKKVLELYKEAKLPTNIQLGDKALLNSIPEREANLIISKLVKNSSKDKKQKTNQSISAGKVIVLGPDGQLTQIGNKLNEDISNKNKKKDREIFYRLLEEIPPYLYYTNKIDTSNTYVKYERENSEKLVTQETEAKKAAEEILNSQKVEEEPIFNKKVLQALNNHAQQMAKIALESNGSGMDLVKDIKMALNENFKKLKAAYRIGEIDVKEFEEYTHLMKESMKKSLSELFSQSIDFSNVIIDDGLLGSLLEYPTSAFEIVTDPETRRKTIQIKKSYKVSHSNLANEMNLDLEQIENEVRNKANQRSFANVNKDAKLETNVNNNTSKNASDAKKTDSLEAAKKIDDDDDDENKPNDTKPIEPISTNPETNPDEQADQESNEKKTKKKAKKPKPTAEELAQAAEDKKNAKKKANKNKKDKKTNEKADNKANEENAIRDEDANLDPKELKRRQQAEEKKKEMLRRRLEKEEEKRREEEELLRKENEAKAAEEEKKRIENELAQKRLAEQEKQRRLLEAQQEKERKKREEEEIKRKAEEEAARKMEEMRIAFIEELTRKAKMEEEAKLAEEQRILEDQKRQYEAAEHERLEIIRRQEEYEESERRRYEEENLRREKELERAINEAKRIAAEEAQHRAEYEARLKFMNVFKQEQAQLENSQLVSRAFIFSYYDLLRFLGDNPPSKAKIMAMAMGEAEPMTQGSKSKRL